jgi:hypothetical protein
MRSPFLQSAPDALVALGMQIFNREMLPQIEASIDKQLVLSCKHLLWVVCLSLWTATE